MSYTSNFNTLTTPYVLLFAASTTWTPSKNCTGRVYVIGAGGGGSTFGSGGAGGGCAIKTMRLTTDKTYTITIGSGGNGGSGSTYGDERRGTNGGNTSFAVTGMNTMWGYGGQGGEIANATAVGGAAANGDFNFSGESRNESFSGEDVGGLCGVFGTVPDGTSSYYAASPGASWYGGRFYGGYEYYNTNGMIYAGGGTVGCGGGKATWGVSASGGVGGRGGNGIVIIEIIQYDG